MNFFLGNAACAAPKWNSAGDFRDERNNEPSGFPQGLGECTIFHGWNIQKTDQII